MSEKPRWQSGHFMPPLSPLSPPGETGSIVLKDIGYNIQRYQPGEYYHWHIDGGRHQFADRQLVALWYINDVEGPGGETEFRFQDVKVTPEEGKLVLFPPFWTHEHRAVTVEKRTKYIATTWVVFA